MSESAVSVRFGGDVAGLAAAVAVAKAQLNQFNAEVRNLAKEAAASSGAVNENLAKALREASAGAAGMQKELKSLQTKPLKEATTATDQFKKSLDRVGEFAWQNTSLSGDEIERVINPIKGLASAFGVLPTVALAASAAAGFAIYKIAEHANEVRTAVKLMSDELSLSGEINAFRGSIDGGKKIIEQATQIESAWDFMGKGAALSTDEAKKFGTELAKLPGLTETMARGFTDLARDERYAFGPDGLAAVQGLATALRKPDDGLKALIASNLRLSPAQRQAAQSALESGNAQKQAATYFQLLTDDLIRQKSEAVLLEEAQSALGGAVAKVASEALEAARASGDFAGALATLAEAGSASAQKLMRVVSAIGSIRSEMARGLGGVELSNQLQNSIDKLNPDAAKVRATAAAFAETQQRIAASDAEVEQLKRGIDTLRASNELTPKIEADINAKLKEQADIREKLARLQGLQSAESRKAKEEQQGGAYDKKAFEDIERTHDVDKDEVAKARDKIAEVEYAITQLDASEIAKRKELETSLADERKNLAEAQRDVESARIDFEIAKEEKGAERKKQLAREKFALETRGIVPNSKEYYEKQTELQGVLDEEPDKKKDKKPKKDTDTLAAANKDIDGQVAAVKQQTEINKQQYELDAANKKITEEQKKTLVQQADDQQLASIKALYEQEKQIAGQKPAQIAEINNKIEALESQHTLKMLQEQTKAAQESAKIGQQEASQMAGTLTSSLSTAIENGLDHVKTKDAGKKIAQSLRNELVNELAKDTLTKPLEAALAPAFKGIFSSITNPISSFLGGALGGGTDAAGGAALTGAATALTTAAAALSSAAAALGAGGVAAGAGGVAAGAGGVAAGAGGAAAGSGGFFSSLFSSLGSLLPAFDQGSFQLPSLGNFDGKGGFPALVHPDEMIVPAGPAGGLRQALKGGGAGAGAGGGGNTVHVAPTFNINATDSQDVHRMFMANQRQFGKAVSKMMRNGVMLGK